MNTKELTETLDEIARSVAGLAEEWRVKLAHIERLLRELESVSPVAEGFARDPWREPAVQAHAWLMPSGETPYWVWDARSKALSQAEAHRD